MTTQTDDAKKSSSFSDNWVFPSEVSKNLGTTRHEVEPSDKTFKSGRPIIYVKFYDESGRLRATRAGMELVSKTTGRPYIVCEKNVYDPQSAMKKFHAAVFDK